MSQEINDEEVKSAEELVEIKSDTLPADVSFDDAQIAAITAAGLEPAQVRNECGLSLVKKEGGITFEEAMQRATEKYLGKSESDSSTT